MTNEQAAQILRDHNEWRRDRSEKAPIGMPESYNPTLLGLAIDVAVKALEHPEPTELERFIAALLVVCPWQPDAKFMSIDEDGSIAQWQWRPYPVYANGWDSDTGFLPIKCVPKCCSIPDGIDWRDCIIERA